ncbi:hypothetical protein JCM10212_007036 [Sporobolomyces blumeae]
MSQASPRVVEPEPATHAGPASDSDNDDARDASRRETKRIKREHGAHDKGKARAAVERDEDESETEEQDEGQDDDDGALRPTGNSSAGSGEKAQLVRDETGYVTGSIVRIACQSFLTYDNVEFRPGPALNMIIGPNGTGKSTIACAIAIGLGFPAKVLGRSNKLASYCKNDSTAETWIELELKGRPGKKNLVVRRVLSRDSEKTKFFLNGNEAAAREVAERMEELQVQVGNLCTFLPQDRVASFAMMSHAELLKETEKAAGDVNLSSWHQLLIDEYRTMKEKQQDVDRLKVQLDRRTAKQAEAEKEVQQFNQRKGLEERRAVVDVLTKYARYQTVYHQTLEAKQDKTRLEGEVKALEEKNRPFKDSKELLSMIYEASTKAQADLEKKVRKAQTQAERKAEDVARNTNESEQLQQELKGLKAADKSRKESIKKQEATIARLEPLVANEPEEADTTKISARIQANLDERQRKQAQLDEVRIEHEAIKREGHRVKSEADRAAQQLKSLQEANTIRENNCKRWDPDTWKAVEWLRENKHQFKGEVYEPPRLTVFPKNEYKGSKLNFRQDADLLNMIEGPISKGAFRTFLFELREDYDKFMHELADTRGLKLNANECGNVKGWADVERPLSDELINDLGFDALACDLLRGPEPVLAFLADSHSLARMPIQIRRRPLNTEKLSQVRAINRYYTRDGSSSVKISLYGNRFAQTENRALKTAVILSGGADEERVKAVNDHINECREKFQQLSDKIDKTRRMGQEINEQIKILNEERETLVEEKKGLGASRRQWFQAQSKLDVARKQLARELEDQRRNSIERQREQIAHDMKRGMTKRVKLVLELKNFVLRMQELQNAAVKLHLQSLQADSDHRAMEAVVRERDQELADKIAELEELKVRYKDMVKDGKRLAAEAEEAITECSEEIKERILERRQNEELNLNRLLDEAAEITANLDCMISISPTVLEQYQRRKVEIAEYTRQLTDASEALEESQTVIAQTRNLWLPRLEALVGEVSKRFTASFETLGLLGEVRLAQDDDYEKWGIEIMVSFRDRNDDNADVTLHVLSGHRQSGGERALTTVTYLLALAELARAPFALVDEINQGMDARAERNMHKMLVETTCKDDVGQYFLLTPKLLPDLVYDEKMKVLVINSGTFIPEDLSLKSIVKRRKELNRTRGRLPALEAIVA